MRSTRAARPVAVTSALVGVTLLLHAIVTAAVVFGAVLPSDRIGSPAALWGAVTWLPSLLWAALVLARSAHWRVVSAFWLPGAATIVGMMMFLMTFVARIAGIDLSGVGTGAMVSSWILVVCAFAVAVTSRLLRVSGDSLAELEASLAEDGRPAQQPQPPSVA